MLPVAIKAHWITAMAMDVLRMIFRLLSGFGLFGWITGALSKTSVSAATEAAMATYGGKRTSLHSKHTAASSPVEMVKQTQCLPACAPPTYRFGERIRKRLGTFGRGLFVCLPDGYAPA
jgi:hypothetical protein